MIHSRMPNLRPPRALPCPSLSGLACADRSVSAPGPCSPHAASLRSTNSAAASCLPSSFFLIVGACRCCARTGSSQCSWLPGCHGRIDLGPRETPRSLTPSLVPRPDASAAGVPVAFGGPVLPLLYPTLGSVSAIACTNRVAHFVFDWNRAAEARLAVRSAPLYSTVHGLVARHD